MSIRSRTILPKSSISWKFKVKVKLRIDKSPGYGPWGDCWRWIGCINNDGYGMYGPRLAAGIVYTLLVKQIPMNKLVLHKCDFRCCVNPKHLFLGTQDVNMKDMVSKNRSLHRFGKLNPNAKITLEKANKIRYLYFKKKIKLKLIAIKFKLSSNTVNKVITRNHYIFNYDLRGRSKK